MQAKITRYQVFTDMVNSRCFILMENRARPDSQLIIYLTVRVVRAAKWHTKWHQDETKYNNCVVLTGTTGKTSIVTDLQKTTRQQISLPLTFPW